MGINTPILPRDIVDCVQEKNAHPAVLDISKKTQEESFKINILIRIYGFFSNRNIKRLNWVLLICIVFVVAYMFKIKGDVQDLNSELAQLSSQIQQEKNQQSVLKAEMAYLRSPERLQRLAMEYLDLESIKPAQLVMADSGGGKLNATKFAVISKKASKAKWKYKNTNYSNIRTVSAR